jgi:hypothetical protein
MLIKNVKALPPSCPMEKPIMGIKHYKYNGGI